MARSEARLAVSIWTDDDFRALSPMAQRMFMFLVSQPDLAHDGVIALRERRWSKAAAGLTVAQISRDLAELGDCRFVVVDEDAEELLIRSFIRRDKVYRQPNVLRSAADHLAVVTSRVILAEIGAELRRVVEAEDIPSGSMPIIAEMTGIIEKGIGNPPPNPSGNPPGDPPNGHLKRDVPITGIGDVETASTGLRVVGEPDDAPTLSEYLETGVSAGVEGSGNPSGNPSDMPTPGTPGERGTVTAVAQRVSPNPVPHSPDPVPLSAPAAPTREARAKRGTRLPEDFTVTPAMIAWFRENTPHVNGQWETEQFRDYWAAASGANATKRNWEAAWRTWMRKAAERAPAGRASPGSALAVPGGHRPSTTDQRMAMAEAAGKEAAAIIRGRTA